MEPMNNFTPRAQQVLALARKEADRFHHNYVGTEHLLLGLIKLGQGVAVSVLQKMGLDLETVRGEVEKQVGIGQESAGKPQISPAKALTELKVEVYLRQTLDLFPCRVTEGSQRVANIVMDEAGASRVQVDDRQAQVAKRDLAIVGYPLSVAIRAAMPNGATG